MARILLTHAYLYRLDPKQWRDHRPYAPLGTLMAAAVLREAGHDVHVHDMGLARSADELQAALERVMPEILVIHDDGFNYLTKMCLTVMREAAFRMITLGKARNCMVAVNSSDASDHAEAYVQHGADAVVHGESEATLRELCQLWSEGADWKSTMGIACLGDEGFRMNAKRPVMRELDDLPMAAWDLIDLKPYRDIWMRAHGYWAINLATTRGCPFKCNWCAKPIYGNRYNIRSPEHVADEVAWLSAHHAPDRIWFADDIFGLKPGWVQGYRDALRERGLFIPYKIQSRVDLLLEGDAIDALVASGLGEAWVGAESGSQRILDAMDKGTTVEQIREATRLLQSKGVRVGFFLQFGYLGETDEDIAKTIAMVDELMPDDIGVSVSYPLPGTKFHEKVRTELDTKANWTDSDDLALLFRSTHRPAFYKRLHRYVHKRFRRKQALMALGGKGEGVLRALSAAYYVPAAAIDSVRLQRLARN